MGNKIAKTTQSFYHVLETEGTMITVIRMERVKNFEDIEQKRWEFDARTTQFEWKDAEMCMRVYTRVGDETVEKDFVVIALNSKEEANHLQPQLQEFLDVMLEKVNT